MCGYCQHDAPARGDNDIVAAGGFRGKQNCDDVEHGDGALQWSEDVNEKDRKGEHC